MNEVRVILMERMLSPGYGHSTIEKFRSSVREIVADFIPIAIIIFPFHERNPIIEQPLLAIIP